MGPPAGGYPRLCRIISGESMDGFLLRKTISNSNVGRSGGPLEDVV